MRLHSETPCTDAPGAQAEAPVAATAADSVDAAVLVEIRVDWADSVARQAVGATAMAEAVAEKATAAGATATAGATAVEAADSASTCAPPHFEPR